MLLILVQYVFMLVVAVVIHTTVMRGLENG